MLAKLPLLALFPCLLLLSACRPSLSRLTSPTPAMPSFTATTYAAGDRATSAASGDAVVVTVTSATGIGALDLTWLPDAAPAALTLHMQLHGLEEPPTGLLSRLHRSAATPRFPWPTAISPCKFRRSCSPTRKVSLPCAGSTSTADPCGATTS